MKYRLICSDLDDTLLGKRLEVTERLRRAVKAYESAGGAFRVVTGRMTVGALPICEAIGLTGELASYQGAIVSDITTGEIYKKTTLSTDTAVRIGRFIEECGWYYQTYVGDAVCTEKYTAFSEMYKNLSRCDCVLSEGKLSDYMERTKLCPPKMLLNAPEKVIPDVLTTLRRTFGDECLFNVSKPFIVEIVPRGVNKGLAVRFLAEKYGVKREEIACLGDSENDATMLDYAGLGVVVKNGSAVAKSHADLVLDYTADEDAVARFLESVTEE